MPRASRSARIIVGATEVAAFARGVALRDQALDLGRVDAARAQMTTLLLVEVTRGRGAHDAEDAGALDERPMVRRQLTRLAGVERAIDLADLIEQDTERTRRIEIVVHRRGELVAVAAHTGGKIARAAGRRCRPGPPRLPRPS